jgi:hypothetical protein
VCREFITGVDGVQLYLDEVKVVGGHNPDLVLDDGARRIDLTAYESVDALHALMRAEGLAPRADRSRLNKNPKCWGWREAGECMKNADFMRTECPLACAHLEDRNDECARWAAAGECTKNTKYMSTHCPVACAKAEL